LEFLIAIKLSPKRPQCDSISTQDNNYNSGDEVVASLKSKMLTTTPHLITRRPSPTTIEFTVSTSPPLTHPLRVLIILAHSFRIALSLTILLLLYAKFLISPFAIPLPTFSHPPFLFSNEYIYYALSRTLSSSYGQTVTSLAALIPLIVLLPLSALLLTLLLVRRSTTESLLVLRGLGIQTTSSAPHYLSTATTRFIPMEKIQDVFVNEAFRGFEVRYLLVVVVEGEGELVVVFPRLLPGRAIVEVVWRGVRACLGPTAGTGGDSRKDENGATRDKEKEANGGWKG
jgi:phosphatidylinositol glycan class H protein